MSEKSKLHPKSELFIFLKKAFFASISFIVGDVNDKDKMKVKSELMLYNTDENGDMYLTIKEPISEFEAIKENKNVSVIVYKEEHELEHICRAIIEGEAMLIEDMSSQEATTGLKLIGERSPMIKHIVYEDEEKKDYTLIYLKVKKINYISFGEIKNKEKPTILARK